MALTAAQKIELRDAYLAAKAELAADDNVWTNQDRLDVQLDLGRRAALLHIVATYRALRAMGLDPSAVRP